VDHIVERVELVSESLVLAGVLKLVPEYGAQCVRVGV